MFRKSAPYQSLLLGSYLVRNAATMHVLGGGYFPYANMHCTQ